MLLRAAQPNLVLTGLVARSRAVDGRRSCEHDLYFAVHDQLPLVDAAHCGRALQPCPSSAADRALLTLHAASAEGAAAATAA